MADMMDRPKLIVIQTTTTESLSRSDPALEPVSTLTGPHPGWSHCFISFTTYKLTVYADFKFLNEDTIYNWVTFMFNVF